MYARQLRYFKTEKGKAAAARCRRKPESVERKTAKDEMRPPIYVIIITVIQRLVYVTYIRKYRMRK